MHATSSTPSSSTTASAREPNDHKHKWPKGSRRYVEGQGDLVSRLITPITYIVTLVTLIINLLTKSP